MSQNTDQSTIPEHAQEWFTSKVWKNGLTLDSDKSTDIEEFHKQYRGNTAGWDKAFTFLKTQDLQALQPGKYPIDGDNVYASVMEAPNMDFDKTSWESHRKFNDIQYVISGKERIGITTESAATVTKEYDEAQDITFYTAEGSLHSFQPGVFFLFFPKDLHRPCIKVDGYEPVKKIVIKVKTV